MKLKYIIWVLILIFLVGCSSVKQTSQTKSADSTNIIIKEEVKKLSALKPDLYELEFDASISTNQDGNQLSFSSKVRIAGYDSIAINVSGPFGIAIAKLFSNKNETVFYNVFENTVYKAKGNQFKLTKFLQMDITLKDLIRIMRLEPIFEEERYNFVKKIDNINSLLFIARNDNYADLAIYSNEQKSITSYQRKLKGDELLIDIQYSNLQKYDSFILAQFINLNYPNINSKATLELTNIKVNQKFENPFSFSYSKNAKIVKIDE